MGRGFAQMKPREEFGPRLPEGWSPKFQRVLSPEQFGPNQPNLPDTDRADRARRTDLGWFDRMVRRWEGMPAVAAAAVVPPPVVDRGWHDARTKDDVTPIVRAPQVERPQMLPPPARDPWLDGDRPGIEERARRGAELVRRDPEAARGQAMMQHAAAGAATDAKPTVDTSAFDVAGAKAAEVGAAMAAALGITAEPQVMTGSIEAAIAKAREFIAVMQQAASVAASAGGGVPAPGAIRAAANRQFAGASHTG